MVNKQASTDVNYTSCNALLNYSIILFFHIYSRSTKGSGIASNHNKELNMFREILKEYIVEKYHIDKAEFESYICKIKEIRNKLVAHYDGNFAEYKEIKKGITRRKMIGAQINKNEIEKLSNYIEAMIECIINFMSA